MIRVGIYLDKKTYYKRAAELKKQGRNISEYVREFLSKPLLSS